VEGCDVIGEAGLDACDGTVCPRRSPDVLVLDGIYPGQSGPKLLANISRRRYTRCHSYVRSMTVHHQATCAELGAQNFVFFDFPKPIESTSHRVLAGWATACLPPRSDLLRCRRTPTESTLDRAGITNRDLDAFLLFSVPMTSGPGWTLSGGARSYRTCGADSFPPAGPP